jgi:peptidoglycan/LPS O-acetylase OafA/YrhL
MVPVLQTSGALKVGEPLPGAQPASRPAPVERSRRAHVSPRASAHLDWIRGLAAAAVMFGHVRGLFFINYSELPRRSAALTLLYALTGLGHQSVMVFFVLSGFFISTSVVSALQERRWSWRAYLINRVSRLELVLFPALLLGALWDQIGVRLISGFALYHSGLYKFYVPSVALRSTPSCFFGNLFFLQSVQFPVFGSNGPLWSLSYEFWYYLLFPALVLAIFSRGSALGRVASFLLAMGVALLVGPHICLYFLIWLAGAAVALSPRVAALRKPWFFWPAALFTSGLFAGALAFSLVRPGLFGAGEDLSIGAAFALWLYVLAHVSGAEVARAYAVPARTLAGFSYTLYLVHFPALLLLRALWNPAGDWEPGALHLLYGVGLAALMLAYAYSIALFTEARTDTVRRRLMQWFGLAGGKREPPPAQS